MEVQLEFEAFEEERTEEVAVLARQAEEGATSDERAAMTRYRDTLMSIDTLRRAVKVVSDVGERNKWQHEVTLARQELQDDRLWAEKRLGAETAERLLRNAFSELAERYGDFQATERDIRFAMSDRLW